MKDQGKSMKDILADIEKTYWWDENMIYTGESVPPTQTISTWSMYMDYILWWWLVKWTLIEIFGENACWKTLISLIALKEAQSRWEKCMFFDAEMSFNKDQAAGLWINMEQLWVIRPTNGEDSTDIIIAAIKAGVTFLVVDSVAAMVARKEAQDSASQSNMWLHARVMNRFCRKVIAPASFQGSTVILINQKRSSMDVFNPVITTWWKWLDYACTQRIEALKPDRTPNWMNFRWKMHKNKLGMSSEKNEKYSMGIDYSAWIIWRYDVLLVAVELGVVEKAWARYKYKDSKANWMKAVWLREDKVIDSIRKDVEKLLKTK